MTSGPASSDDPSDHSLVLRVAEGDRGAFEILYQRYSRRLAAFLKARANAADADEVHNQIWINVFQHPPSADGRKFLPWLFQVARNELINHWRRNKRHQHSELEDFSAIVAEHSDDSRPELVTDLNDCISRLSQEFAGVVKLYMLGTAHAKIAEHLGIPLNTSYTRLGRAKGDLKECLHRKGWTTMERVA